MPLPHLISNLRQPVVRYARRTADASPALCGTAAAAAAAAPAPAPVGGSSRLAVLLRRCGACGGGGAGVGGRGSGVGVGVDGEHVEAQPLLELPTLLRPEHRARKVQPGEVDQLEQDLRGLVCGGAQKRENVSMRARVSAVNT